MNVNPIWLKTKDQTDCQSDMLADDAPIKDRIIAAMRSVRDPEISVNIFDLGLIYDWRINDNAQVHVSMTLTSPACPVAGSLVAQVACAIKAVNGIKDAQVELVWNPPWDKERISDEAKLALGLF